MNTGKSAFFLAIFIIACPLAQVSFITDEAGGILTGSPSPYKWVNGLWTFDCGSSGAWDDSDIYTGGAIWDQGVYKVFYCGVNATGIARSGLATSTDSVVSTHICRPPGTNTLST